MGKISDALEKYRKEKTVKTETLLPERLEKGKTTASETVFPRRLTVRAACDPKLIAYLSPDSLDAENFKVLRAQVLYPKENRRPRTLLVTSAFPGEGKTFVAANLAVSIALGINEYVLTVDCDFRRPSLHGMFGYENHEGLHEYLVGKKDLPDLLIKTEIKKLSLLTAGVPASNPSELLSSKEMKAFLKEVSDRYDDRYIIIDATPNQVASEVGVLSQYVDGVILVIRSGRSPREMVKKSVENIGKKKILGVVFNGYNEGLKPYHKYYRKYYKP